MPATEQEEHLYRLLAGIIRDAFFEARDAGKTMYQASDDASARVLSVLMPSALRLHHEMSTLLGRWELDQRDDPGSADWQARIADLVLSKCIDDLRQGIERAMPKEPKLEAVPETG